MQVIARVRNDFPTKFGLPRQSGLVEEVRARVVFEPEFRVREALRGLEEFSHIWLIWGFHRAEREHWSPTVRPPRLGGNTRLGVFATRSPFRPNGLGLSCVRLLDIADGPDGPELHIAGADMMDGTPVYDIKPYLPYADCRPDATGGFAARAPRRCLRVEADEAVLAPLDPPRREALLAALREDPRPAYQDDPAREYGFLYGEWNVRFRVAEGVLTVTALEPTGSSGR